MGNKNYSLRVFECPECHNKLYASKSANKMTSNGHIKTMWCPICKKENDFVQIDKYNVKNN